MKPCCPPGEGCNARVSDEPCSLTLLRRERNTEARRALSLWDRYQHAAGSPRGRRFLKRAYQRARDRVLGVWTPWDERPLAGSGVR
ncbi:MAG TPA: hypothetical protein VKB54_15075 [Solirubrobacteraceae bacterium]|nr:hypothetical protein [Solirubrobacteraceae bacterium]